MCSCSFPWHCVGHVILAVISGTTIFVPYPSVKSLQLIWGSDTCRFHLRVPYLQMSCSDLTMWQGTRIVVPAVVARLHASLMYLCISQHISCLCFSSLFQVKILQPNSWRPSDAYMHQYNIHVPTLLQIMACHLFGAKPLSEPMLPYCQLDPKEHISVKLYLKFKSFHSRKCTWKYRLPKWQPSWPASMW